jgi:probable addiction module antidote protein
MAKATAFDAADYLDGLEDIANYLSEALETGDAAYIAQAIGTAAKAQGNPTDDAR